LLLLSLFDDVTALKVAVPAYFYPNTLPDPVWTEMNSGYPTCSVVIANVNSGPGTIVDSQYAAQINLTVAANLIVVGYVPSAYGATPIATVKANIDLWYQLYPGIRGIFVDEGASSCTYANYYTSITSYVKAKQANALVIVNPGTTVPSCFANATDVIVNYEDVYANYAAFTPAGWESAYPVSKFYHIVYDTPAAQMPSVVAQISANHVGYLYVTNATSSNPYDALPGYWTSFLQQVAALSTTPTPTPTPTPSTTSPPTSTSPPIIPTSTPTHSAAITTSVHAAIVFVCASLAAILLMTI
jgi:hypothetical protein